MKQGEIQYPVTWEFRIIAGSDVFENVRTEVIRLAGVYHQKEVNPQEGLRSGGGKYRTIKLTAVIESRTMMEEFTTALAAVPGVKFVL